MHYHPLAVFLPANDNLPHPLCPPNPLPLSVMTSPTHHALPSWTQYPALLSEFIVHFLCEQLGVYPRGRKCTSEVFPTVPGACSVLGYTMKLWRILSLRLLSGSSEMTPRLRPSGQAVFRSQLHPAKASVGMGFLNILEGPHTFVSKLQRALLLPTSSPPRLAEPSMRGGGGKNEGVREEGLARVQAPAPQGGRE